MARAVRRHGKGLNSFLYRPQQTFRPSRKLPTPVMVTKQEKYADDDPNKYHIRGSSGGGFEIVDRNTGKITAQADTRGEAQDWITDAVKV